MGKTPLTEPEMYALLAKNLSYLRKSQGGLSQRAVARILHLPPKNHYELRKLQGHSACLCCPETGRLLRLLRGRPADKKSHRKEIED